jgi:hypothetical protein
VDHLTLEDLLDIAERVVGRVLVRDVGMLAAAARPRATAFGEEAHVVYGGTRLVWAATRVSCLVDGRDLGFAVDDAEAMVVTPGDLDVPESSADTLSGVTRRPALLRPRRSTPPWKRRCVASPDPRLRSLQGCSARRRTVAEETWNEARLIPTSGISGVEEQERRATSALLAVMTSVREFGRSLTQSVGAPAGAVQAYIEVPFTIDDRKVYPDGLIHVSRGQRSWTALVEVKTGTNTLDAQQLETYLQIARDRGYQALITISNEVPAVAGQHPTQVDKRLLRKVELHHWSWTQVLSEAVMQKEHRGIADPDQAWILGELIRYLEHPRSGALEFDDMGPSWVHVREALAAGTLRASDKGLAEVASRFDALLRFASLQLGRRLGTEVAPALSRKELLDPSLRAQALIDSLVHDGVLEGAIRIPDTVGTLVVTADLRAGRITCHLDLEAPREGRPTTRVNWLVRQLRNAPETVRVEAFAARTRGSGQAELLKVVRQDPSVLIADPLKELKSFRIALTSPAGPKRGRGRGSFIDSVLGAVDTFYAEVLQHLKAWSAAPPRLRESIDPGPTQTDLDSNALSSQDGAEPTAVPSVEEPDYSPRTPSPDVLTEDVVVGVRA